MLVILPENPLLIDIVRVMKTHGNKNSNRLQTDRKWLPEFQNTGCHYFCFLFTIEQETGTKGHYEEWVTTTFLMLRTKNIMSKESFVVYPDKFLDFIAPDKFEYVGIKPLDYVIEPDDRVIGMYQWGDKKHFVVLDHLLNIIYDPEGESPTVKNGQLKSLRIIRVKHGSEN